jgi:hypothetical protein
MSDIQKINSSHLARVAVVYLRQSSCAQVEHNRESTDRQYALAHKASELGWPADRVVVIDEDLGLTGSGAVARSGFARLTAEVALGHVGLVLGLEVSRLARNNADWYRLIDLCGLSDTLIGDADGVYHPGLFNDRLLLGLKGTMSEAELYILAPGSTAAFATRRRAVSFGAVCRSALSGARPMAKSASIPMKPCVQPSPRSSRDSPRPVRRGVCGCGSDPRAFACRCGCISGARSAGWRPATPPSTTY